MPFAEGCYLVRSYPLRGEPGRHVSRISFYLRPGIDPSARAGGEQRNIAEAFADIIRDEDYVMSASQQRTAESGVVDHVVFGRNEPALHHYHSTYRAVFGMEPLPLVTADQLGDQLADQLADQLRG